MRLHESHMESLHMLRPPGGKKTTLGTLDVVVATLHSSPLWSMAEARRSADCSSMLAGEGKRGMVRERKGRGVLPLVSTAEAPAGISVKALRYSENPAGTTPTCQSAFHHL